MRGSEQRGWYGVADVDGLLGSLGASFEARIERDEAAAAADLAFSLAQDVPLAADLLRLGPSEVDLGAAGWSPIVAVGVDHLWAGSSPARALVPLGAAVVRGRASGGSPDRSDRTFLAELRDLARRRAAVAVTCDDGIAEGRLLAARPDHVLLQTARTWSAVALGRVRAVRLLSPGRRPWG